MVQGPNSKRRHNSFGEQSSVLSKSCRWNLHDHLLDSGAHDAKQRYEAIRSNV